MAYSWTRPIADIQVRDFEEKTCPVCGQIGVLHRTMPHLFTVEFWTNQLTLKRKVSYEPYKLYEMACYSAIFHIIVVSGAKMTIPSYLSGIPFPNVDWAGAQKPIAIVDGVLVELASTSSVLNGDVAYIVGLNQRSYSEHVTRFQVRALHFYEMRVADLAGLLNDQVKELAIHWNTKLVDLEPLSELVDLEYLVLEDVPKVSSLAEIGALSKLKGVEFSGGIWNKNAADSLTVLSELPELRHLILTNLKVQSGGLRPIAGCRQLKELEISNQFPTEDYAYLAAKLPDVKCNMFRPHTDASNIREGTVMITGKGKPFLSSKQDSEKIRKYEDKFARLVDEFSR